MLYGNKGGIKLPLALQGVIALIGFIAIIVVITVAFSMQEERSNAPKGNIIVFSPEQNGLVNNTFVVSGVARVPDGELIWKITNPAGETITEGTAEAPSPNSSMFGYFSFPVSLPETYDQTFVDLSVSSKPQKDSSHPDTMLLTLTRSGEKARAVVVYFPNNMLNPQAIDCSVVFPVYREIPDVPGMARFALEKLFAGPSEEERKYGFATSIPSGVTINSLSLVNGTLQADFSNELEAGVAGSCYVLSLRSQVTKTLEQFPSVTHAQLSIEGRTEDILQP